MVFISMWIIFLMMSKLRAGEWELVATRQDLCGSSRGWPTEILWILLRDMGDEDRGNGRFKEVMMVMEKTMSKMTTEGCSLNLVVMSRGVTREC